MSEKPAIYRVDQNVLTFPGRPSLRIDGEPSPAYQIIDESSRTEPRVISHLLKGQQQSNTDKEQS